MSAKDPPSFLLAKRIAERLVKERLLESRKVDRFVQLLADGKLKESDWRLDLEAVAKPGR